MGGGGGGLVVVREVVTFGVAIDGVRIKPDVAITLLYTRGGGGGKFLMLYWVCSISRRSMFCK